MCKKKNFSVLVPASGLITDWKIQEFTATNEGYVYFSELQWIIYSQCSEVQVRGLSLIEPKIPWSKIVTHPQVGTLIACLSIGWTPARVID